MWWWCRSGVVILSTLAMMAQADQAQEQNKDSPGASYHPNPMGRLLIGVRRSLVISTGYTTTKTVEYTCYTKINSGTCSGKRKRRRTPQALNVPDRNYGLGSVDVVSSLDEDAVGGPEESNIPLANSEVREDSSFIPKLVIWTTSYTTITFTSSSTKSGTTVTVAYSCTASSMSLPTACG